MNNTIKIYDNRIQVFGQAAITPNLQGETGFVFPDTILNESVEDFKRLIDVAPYYRLMLDSHIELKDAQWGNVGGIIDNVYLDEQRTVRIDYTVFGGTSAYNALKNMHLAGLNPICPISTRGFGKVREVKVGEGSGFGEDRKIKIIRKLGDSQVTFWKKLGTQIYKNILKILDHFVLLGWDLVVIPSQFEAGAPLISDSPKIIAESSGNLYVKMVSDRTINLSNFVVGKLSGKGFTDIREAAASLNISACPISPALRLKLLDINDDFSRNIRVEEKNDKARIIW